MESLWPHPSPAQLSSSGCLPFAGVLSQLPFALWRSFLTSQAPDPICTRDTVFCHLPAFSPLVSPHPRCGPLGGPVGGGGPEARNVSGLGKDGESGRDCWWGSTEIGETQNCAEFLGRCGPTSSELGSGVGRRLRLFPRQETGAFSLRCCWALSPLAVRQLPSQGELVNWSRGSVGLGTLNPRRGFATNCRVTRVRPLTCDWGRHR